MRAARGHTLVESLVVVAIISMMLAVAVPHYVRAIRMAKQTAADEAKHQRFIGKAVDGGPQGSREDARAAYRVQVDAGKFDHFLTEMLYVVRNDQEFEAYWNTLLNWETETQRLEFDDSGNLLARDFSGNVVPLVPIYDNRPKRVRGDYPLSWDFLSTNMAHMSIGRIGISVQWSAGNIELLNYPNKFPATPLVATLSQRFMEEVYDGP